MVEDGERDRRSATPRADLRASLEINDPRAWTGMLRGSTGFGEGYVEGYWDSDDLVALVRIAARNTPAMDALKRRFASALVPAQRLGGMVPRNTRLGARENISAHYDLGNDLFESFLDERMQYSSALLSPAPRRRLEEAQLAKLDRICDGLRLGPERPPARDRHRLGRPGDPRRRRSTAAG